MGKITKPSQSKRSILGDWSKFNPKVALIGFFCFVVGLALIFSGHLDQSLEGLGVFSVSLGLFYWSVKDVWEK